VSLLNIDYAAIIKKADERRETLQKLDAMMVDTSRHMRALVDAIEHFKALSVERNKLDPEGVQLLGHVSPAISETYQATERLRAEILGRKSWMGDKNAYSILGPIA
jgi:hypothetical protein